MKTTKKLKRMVAGVLASLMAMSGTANICAADTEENVHLSMAFWAEQSEIDRLDQLLEIWKADHPNVTLDYTYCSGPDYPTKLQVWFSSGKAPDVIRMSRDIFSPYNKDIFDEANLEYPTADWTETEFVELAKTLTSGEGPEKTYGMWFGGWVCELVRALYGEPKMYDTENMVMQATNNEKFKAAFQLLGDLHKDGYCSNEVTKTTTTGGFVTGKYAMAIAMTGDIASYQKQIGDNFKWDIVELPISETYDTRWNTNMRLQGFGMSKTTEHPELSYDLIEYMTTNYEVQKAVDEDGVGIPALTEYLESEEFKTNYGDGLAYNKEAFVNMAKVGTSWEYAGIWADINDTLTSEFNAYITGATDIDTALDNLQKKGEAVIEAAKS